MSYYAFNLYETDKFRDKAATKSPNFEELVIFLSLYIINRI